MEYSLGNCWHCEFEARFDRRKKIKPAIMERRGTAYCQKHWDQHERMFERHVRGKCYCRKCACHVCMSPTRARDNICCKCRKHHPMSLKLSQVELNWVEDLFWSEISHEQHEKNHKLTQRIWRKLCVAFEEAEPCEACGHRRDTHKKTKCLGYCCACRRFKER